MTCQDVVLIQRLVCAETHKGRAERNSCDSLHVRACSEAEQTIDAMESLGVLRGCECCSGRWTAGCGQAFVGYAREGSCLCGVD